MDERNTKIKWLRSSSILALGLLVMGAIGPNRAMANRQDDLADVSHWLYLIDVNNPQDPNTQNQIVKSSHDMVVLDFIPSERCNTPINNPTFNMAALVANLQKAPNPKLVLAYIDIGQAEDYREYWPQDPQQKDCEKPDKSFSLKHEWVLDADPEDWPGVFNVAFWYPEYKEIWLGKSGKDGYLKQIVDAGFDGVYLDWLEAYDDPSVFDKAAADCKDPLKACVTNLKDEMIKWVSEIATFTRVTLGQSDFIVIGQNAAELAQDKTYVNIVDAIAQEQAWFDGGANDVPPGDCPLPSTVAEVNACGKPNGSTWNTCTYYQSLSKVCQDQYNKFPDGTLHFSSNEYLSYLNQAKSKGLHIFTADYAVWHENVAKAYQNSRKEGFVPFVSNRNLDTYREPVPFELFEELIPGTNYFDGDKFTTSGVEIEVKTFYDSSGNPSTGGYATVTNSGASLNTVIINKVNLHLDFPRRIKNLAILYDEGDDEVRLEINGVIKYFNSFKDIDGQFIGGVSVSVVTLFPSFGIGIISLKRGNKSIESFAIGGDLLWIDVEPPLPFHALYVWRDPQQNGTPITLAEAGKLADFAITKHTSTIYYDYFGCGSTPGCPTAAQEHSVAMAPMISKLHAYGLRVEALVTNYSDFSTIFQYNSTAQSSARFDGIRLDMAFPGGEPTVADLAFLAPEVAEVSCQLDLFDPNCLPVYASIDDNWDTLVTYNGQSKEVFKHMLDIVAGMDVRTARDDAIQIVQDAKDEVCYANSIRKPAHTTIETSDVKNNSKTFFDEDEAKMKRTVDKLDYAAACSSGSAAIPTGFAYHFYRQSFGSYDLGGWETDLDGDAIVESVDLLRKIFSNDFSDVGLGGTTKGTISERGDRKWLIKDHKDSGKGLRIKVGAGDEDAQIKGYPKPGGLCQPKTVVDIKNPGGSNIDFTCGSTTVEVTEGSAVATATVDGLVASVTVPAGGGVSFDLTDDGTLLVTNVGTTPLSGDILMAASKDSFIRRPRRNRNEGANETLVVQKRKRAVVAFDLSAVPADDVVITSAMLVMSIAEPAMGWGKWGGYVDAYRLMAPFTEGNGYNWGKKRRHRIHGSGAGITWHCATDEDISNRTSDCDFRWKGGLRSAGKPTEFGGLHTKWMTGEVAWDVTDDVLDALAEGAMEVRWLLKREKKRRRGKVVYYSKEGADAAGDPNLAPRLILEFES